MRTPPTPCVASYADNIMCSQGQSFIQDRNTQSNVGVALTLVRGRHLARLGAQFESSYDNAAQTNVASGAFDFCGVGEPCFTGISMADFLLGYADNFSNVNNHYSAQAVVPAFTAGDQDYRAVYFNDTWRATGRLSMNLGLRYELESPWTERFNRLSYFDPSASSYLNQYLAIASAPVMGDVFLISGSRHSLPMAKDNLAPRLGLAYSLSPSRILRGGDGVFWIPIYFDYALNPDNDMVNAAATTFTGTVDGVHPYNTISLPFPAGISAPPGRSLGVQGTQQFLTQVVQSITEIDRNNDKRGYMQQWNLSIEQQLPSGFSLVAAYVGARGTHLAGYSPQIDQISDSLLAGAATQYAQGGRSAVDLLRPTANPFVAGGQVLALGTPLTTAGQLLRPYPQYTSLELAGQGLFDSIYHSLQLTAQKRFQVGGEFLAAYTKAKLISNTDSLTAWLENTVGVTQDNNNLRGERSLSSQDAPQRLVLGYVVDLPFGQNKPYLGGHGVIVNRIVGDWGLDGVTTWQRGFPLVFSNGQVNDVTLFGAGSRPNLATGCIKSAAPGSERLQQWFNTSCFAAPPDFTFGSEPRADPTLRADGVANFDVAVFKRLDLGEQHRATFEFRVEFFNLFNRVQFAPPNTTCCSAHNADFGVVTSTDPGTNPRLVQFASKVSF
jgi:hypothetical protein